MVKKLAFISVLVLLLVVILLMAPTCQCGQGAQQSVAPPGPPQVKSFKIVNENVAPGDLPLFTWEAANASAVTITQDGEEVFHIESVPDSAAGASFNPLQSRVFASTVDEGGPWQPYSPGIYPVGFKGASNGKPTKVISDFGDNFTVQASAEIKALSDDGQGTGTKVTFFNFVAEGQGSSPPQITAPPCASPGASEPIIPSINSWSVKNGEIDEGTAPQYEFNVTNAAIISINQGGKLISYTEIVNPPSSGTSSLPSLTAEAYASATGEYEMKLPCSPGVYPVIYQGSSSGRPQTIALGPGENFTTDFAEITVCSPTGHTATATVKFGIIQRGIEKCVAPYCECLTVDEAKAKSYTLKCGAEPCGKQLAEFSGSSLKMAHETAAEAKEIVHYNYKYCFRQCPPGCECLTQKEGGRRACYTGTSWPSNRVCGQSICGYDKLDGNPMLCCPGISKSPSPDPATFSLPSVIVFTASRNVVEPMEPVTLTWNVTACDNMTVKLVSDGIERTVQPSGSESIIAVKSACYYITADCQGTRGVKSQCITVQTSGMQIPPVRPPMYPPYNPPDTQPDTPPACPTCPPTDGPKWAPGT